MSESSRSQIASADAEPSAAVGAAWARSELAWDGETANTWKARAQAAEQALSDLKREVLEKVGPLVRIAHLFGKLPDQDVSVVRSGPRSGNARVGHFRALSTLYEKLSSIEVRPESPGGDVKNAAGEGEP